MAESLFTLRFAALHHGRTPFRWQSRLYERFLANDIPAVCTLPTGLGKTSGSSRRFVVGALSVQRGGWGVVRRSGAAHGPRSLGGCR